MKVFLAVCFLFLSLVHIQANIISDPNLSLSQLQQEEISDLYEILLAVYDNNITLIPNDPNELLALETSEDSRDLLAWEIIKMIRGVWEPNTEYVDDSASIVLEEHCVPDESLNSVSRTPVESSDDQSAVNSSETHVQTLLLTGPIEELSNPLGSRILESKTYRITTLPLEIEGHVVIPAGTKLIAPFDPNGIIIEVMPGGLLDMGKAVNISDPNFQDVLPPVEIVSEDPNQYYNNNYVGIYVNQGANPATRICNTIIENCTIGIIIAEQLINPIQHVVTYVCYNGLYVYTPNTILDSEFWCYGRWEEEILDNVGVGIYVCLDDRRYAYPVVRVSRTVMYSGDFGLYIEGIDADPNLPDPNQVIPGIELVNSVLASNNYYGVYKTDADANIDMEYCAFRYNWWDCNFDSSFTGCIALKSYPDPEADPEMFYRIGDDKKLYVNPLSKLVDSGYGMAEDGMGTCHYQPDIGQMDIGCHFPIGVTGTFGIPSSPADFNWDGIVDEWDLGLMNLCMGATGDPGILMLDTNYDFMIDLPDFGLFAADYGYSNDANLPGNHDPNCERSDFDGDHQVDLEDLEILSQNWLVFVFDSNSVCSLCNLDYVNEPNEPISDTIIDSRDYDAFMAEWGKTSYAGCSVTFNNKTGQVIEPNSLSEEITLFPQGFLPSTTTLFAQIDGHPAGLSYPGFDEQPSIAIPTDEYGNGWHTLTVGGYTTDDGCWMENVKVQFQNSLYLVSVPEKYEPNQPLYFSAFNNGNDDVSVEVYADCGNLVWSQTYTGNEISYAIPLEITGQHEIDYINFDKSDGTSITKIADPTDLYFPLDIKALIILPDNHIRINNFRSTWAVQNAFKNRGIKYKKLCGKSANYSDIALYALTNPIKYVYVDSHGEYRIGGVLRTYVVLADGIAVSMKQSDFISGQEPSWCISLGNYWENRANSIFSMGFNGLDFAYFNCCYTGRLKINQYDQLVEGSSGQLGLVTDGPHSDMSIALGIYDTNKSNFYQGWYETITTRFPQIGPYETEYQKWTRQEWEKLGDGGNLEEAIDYAINQQPNLSDPNAPVNIYRLKGIGLFTDIRLHSN